MVHKLVQSDHPFVFLRGRTFYFRYALPLHIRKLCPRLPAELKRSLRTDSFSDAIAMVNAKLPFIKILKVCTDEKKIGEIYGLLSDFSHQLADWVKSKFDVLKSTDHSRDVRTTKDSDIGTAAPKLSVIWQDFVRWKQWNPRRTDQNQRTFDTLLFFLGDVSVKSISKGDLKRALTSIAALPLRNKSPYRGVSLKRIVQMDIPEEDLLSSKSVKEHLKLAQSIFNSYLVRELDALERSPTDGLRWEVEDSRYASLTNAQVRNVLLRAQSKPKWFWWFLMIAVYSGARRSEIASLRSCDFSLCDDTGRSYFVIRSGKTKAARRMIPVHNKLVSAGLLSWIGRGDGLIFPIAAQNLNRVTDNFGSLLDQQENDLGERIVFHSTRHTFITKARSKGASTPLVQQVVGHEKSGAGITDRYTHSFQMRDVLSVVDDVSYD